MGSSMLCLAFALESFTLLTTRAVVSAEDAIAGVADSAFVDTVAAKI